MSAACVDSASLVTVALEQLEAHKARERLATFERIYWTGDKQLDP